MKIPVIIFSLFAIIGTCRAESPQLFRERNFTSKIFAEAVNHFVSIGESGAVKELCDLRLDWTQNFQVERSGFSVNERIGWMCRVLFQAKGKEPLLPPMFGANTLPYRSMPLKSWPMYPIALSGNTYFVLSQGYSFEGFGGPEDPKSYIDYCRTAGNFRKIPIPIPTREEALRDVAALRQSPAWKAIKWTDRGQGWSYNYDEEWIWSFIQKQAKAIK